MIVVRIYAEDPIMVLGRRSIHAQPPFDYAQGGRTALGLLGQAALYTGETRKGRKFASLDCLARVNGKPANGLHSALARRGGFGPRVAQMLEASLTAVNTKPSRLYALRMSA